jgi:hypothetical protein
LFVTFPPPKRPKEKEKQSSKRQAENYPNNACTNRTFLDVAQREIAYRAEREEQ